MKRRGEKSGGDWKSAEELCCTIHNPKMENIAVFLSHFTLLFVCNSTVMVHANEKQPLLRNKCVQFLCCVWTICALLLKANQIQFASIPQKNINSSVTCMKLFPILNNNHFVDLILYCFFWSCCCCFSISYFKRKLKIINLNTPNSSVFFFKDAYSEYLNLNQKERQKQKSVSDREKEWKTRKLTLAISIKIKSWYASAACSTRRCLWQMTIGCGGECRWTRPEARCMSARLV